MVYGELVGHGTATSREKETRSGRDSGGISVAWEGEYPLEKSVWA